MSDREANPDNTTWYEQTFGWYDRMCNEYKTRHGRGTLSENSDESYDSDESAHVNKHQSEHQSEQEVSSDSVSAVSSDDESALPDWLRVQADYPGPGRVECVICAFDETRVVYMIASDCAAIPAGVYYRFCDCAVNHIVDDSRIYMLGIEFAKQSSDDATPCIFGAHADYEDSNPVQCFSKRILFGVLGAHHTVVTAFGTPISLEYYREAALRRQNARRRGLLGPVVQLAARWGLGRDVAHLILDAAAPRLRRARW